MMLCWGAPQVCWWVWCNYVLSCALPCTPCSWMLELQLMSAAHVPAAGAVLRAILGQLVGIMK